MASSSFLIFSYMVPNPLAELSPAREGGGNYQGCPYDAITKLEPSWNEFTRFKKLILLLPWHFCWARLSLRHKHQNQYDTNTIGGQHKWILSGTIQDRA
jgi:hypothetical protein